MRRAGAAERYFFDREYFDAALSFERSWLVVARRDGELGAGAIAAMQRLAPALLPRRHRRRGARRLAVQERGRGDARPRRRARAAAQPRRRGRPGDGLEEFKRGFANAELAFHTHEVVCDPGEYERLGAGSAAPPGSSPPTAPSPECAARRRCRPPPGAAVRRRRVLGHRRGPAELLDPLCDQAADLGDLALERVPGTGREPDRAVAEDLLQPHLATLAVAAQVTAGRDQRRVADRGDAVDRELPGQVVDDRLLRLRADRELGVGADRGDRRRLRVEALRLGADDRLLEPAGAARRRGSRSGRRAPGSRCRSSRCRCGDSGRSRARSPAPPAACSRSRSPCGGSRRP